LNRRVQTWRFYVARVVQNNGTLLGLGPIRLGGDLEPSGLLIGKPIHRVEDLGG
jgi:hypothetical protein